MMRPHYSARLVDGGRVIAVVDKDDGMTVTTGAEQVVAELGTTYGLAGKRVIYCDTEGWWDELRHDGRRFTGFAPVRKRDLNEALAHLRRQEAS